MARFCWDRCLPPLGSIRGVSGYLLLCSKLLRNLVLRTINLFHDSVGARIRWACGNVFSLLHDIWDAGWVGLHSWGLWSIFFMWPLCMTRSGNHRQSDCYMAAHSFSWMEVESANCPKGQVQNTHILIFSTALIQPVWSFQIHGGGH